MLKTVISSGKALLRQLSFEQELKLVPDISAVVLDKYGLRDDYELVQARFEELVTGDVIMFGGHWCTVFREALKNVAYYNKTNRPYVDVDKNCRPLIDQKQTVWKLVSVEDSASNIIYI